MTTPELKRCPFCNSQLAKVDSYRADTNDKHTEFAIRCGNCGASGPNDLTEKRAVNMWNLRRANGIFCRLCGVLVEFGKMKPWRKDDDTLDLLCPGCDSVLVEGE